MNQAISAKKRKPEPVYLRVIQGGLVPADNYAQEQLRNKKFKIGDVVKCDVRKLRNPKFNRLVHRIGQLCAENIEEFSGMDAHRVIKRLQLEGNIYCDEIAIKPYSLLIVDSVLKAVKPILDLFGLQLSDDGLLIVRIPVSLSFESLDEEEFHDAAKKICRLIAERYWKGLEPDQIAEMAESMVEE